VKDVLLMSCGLISEWHDKLIISSPLRWKSLHSNGKSAHSDGKPATIPMEKQNHSDGKLHLTGAMESWLLQQESWLLQMTNWLRN
jgi:hypothetical protein